MSWQHPSPDDECNDDDFNDEDDFSDKVRYLVEHPAKARSIGDAGMRSVSRYSWAECAASFLDLMTDPAEDRAAA